MAKVFIERGFDVVSDGTDDHLMLVSLIAKGITAKRLMPHWQSAHHVNKNAVPNDPQSPFVTSGIRVAPGANNRGFKETEMIEIANMMCDVMENIEDEEVIAIVREKSVIFARGFRFIVENRNAVSPARPKRTSTLDACFRSLKLIT